MMAREDWTDERLDYFEKGVGDRFDGIRVEVAHLGRRMDERFDRVDERFKQIDAEFDRMDKRFEQVDKRFDHVDKRFDQVGKRFEQVDQRFDRVETDVQELKRAIERQNAFMLGGFVGLAGLIVSNAIFF